MSKKKAILDFIEWVDAKQYSFESVKRAYDSTDCYSEEFFSHDKELIEYINSIFGWSLSSDVDMSEIYDALKDLRGERINVDEFIGKAYSLYCE